MLKFISFRKSIVLIIMLSVLFVSLEKINKNEIKVSINKLMVYQQGDSVNIIECADRPYIYVNGREFNFRMGNLLENRYQIKSDYLYCDGVGGKVEKSSDGFSQYHITINDVFYKVDENIDFIKFKSSQMNENFIENILKLNKFNFHVIGDYVFYVDGSQVYLSRIEVINFVKQMGFYNAMSQYDVLYIRP